MRSNFLAGLIVLLALPGAALAAPVITDGGRSLQWPKPADVLQTSATVTGTNVYSVNLFVDTGSGFSSVPMTNESGNLWKATIPGTGSLAEGTYVKYYYQATDDSGSTVFPANAPTAFKVFLVDSNPVGANDIVINEIMYDPTGSDNADGNWSEFIELYNRRPTPVRLDYFTIGRNLTDSSNIALPENTEIPGNGYLVLAGNLSAFTTRYGTLTPPAIGLGFTGSWLNNTSGVANITHLNALGFGSAKGTPFDQVPYTSSAPWPGGFGSGFSNPNNFGPSIELTNPAYDNSVGDNWKTSTLILGDRSRGTPGVQNSTFEEFNLSASNVTRNVQYPTTTSTITISATVVGPNPITQVQLFADLRDGNGFHAIANMTNSGGSSYQATVGPFPNKTTLKYYVQAEDGSSVATSPDDAPNSFNVVVIDDAPVGAADVVINEVMYDPPGNDNSVHSEWVELYNRSDVDLNLEFFQFSPRTTGYSQVILPEGTTITAHGYLVLAGRKSLFLADYPDGSLSQNIDPDKVIDLGWSNLNIMQNVGSGDSPNLRHANAVGYVGAPNAAFDNVPYTGAAPWPAGLNNDGGASIELKDPALNNASGSNWAESSSATAPTGTPLLLNSTSTAKVNDWSMY